MSATPASERDGIESAPAKPGVGTIVPIDNSSDQNQPADVLSAYLAEYGWLRAEIQNRSDYQHRIFQMHVTAITLLLVTGLSGAFSRWVILAIPFESAIFGLWWLDHARTIRTIGRYLSHTLEPKIDKLIGTDNVIGWQRRVELPGANDRGLRRIAKGYQSVSDFAFLWPSGLVLIVCVLGVVVAAGNPFPQWLDDTYVRFLPLASEFERSRPWILAAGFIGGLWMFGRYAVEYRQFGDLIRKQHEQSAATGE